jgi:hypothetical protein
MHEGDSTNIVYLINHGVKSEKGKVIAWFPKDSLSQERINGILDTINIGIERAENFIGAPYGWQVQEKGSPYTFYFRFDKCFAHASGAGFVSISFSQIKRGEAPWLHEAVHEMLNTKSGDWLGSTVTEEEWDAKTPLWLQEGLAEYIAIEVSETYHLKLYDMFTNSNQKNLDTLFKEDIKHNNAKEILSHIGSSGNIKKLLFSESRKQNAGAFYHLSASFVKYLAEKYGIRTLVESNAAFRNELIELEKRINSNLEKEKSLWIGQN